MIVVLFLGDNDEYLGYKSFQYKYQAELAIEKLHPVMIANIEGKLSLKERLELVPEYFPFVGRLQNVELIELNNEGEKKNE